MASVEINAAEIAVLQEQTDSLQSQTASLLADKADKTTTVNGHALTGNVTVTKGDVGLGNCDNTADASKPVSSATQSALNAKAPVNAPSFTGGMTVAGLPTSAAGLTVGQVWIDTEAGNVLKIVTA